MMDRAIRRRRGRRRQRRRRRRDRRGPLRRAHDAASSAPAASAARRRCATSSPIAASTRWATTPRQAVTGVAEEVMQGLRRLGAVTGPQRHRGVFVVFEPGGGEARARHALRRGRRRRAAARLRLRRDARRTAASSSLAGRTMPAAHTVRARAFVDASGEGDLAFFAGAATRYGNDGAGQSRHARHALRRHPREVDGHRRPAHAARRPRRRQGAGPSPRTAA